MVAEFQLHALYIYTQRKTQKRYTGYDRWGAQLKFTVHDLLNHWDYTK